MQSYFDNTKQKQSKLFSFCEEEHLVQLSHHKTPHSGPVFKRTDKKSIFKHDLQWTIKFLHSSTIPSSSVKIGKYPECVIFVLNSWIGSTVRQLVTTQIVALQFEESMIERKEASELNLNQDRSRFPATICSKRLLQIRPQSFGWGKIMFSNSASNFSLVTNKTEGDHFTIIIFRL